MRVIWTQWDDLEVPDGVEAHSDPALLEETGFLARVQVYVPTYMAGSPAFEPVASMTSLALLQLPTAGYDDALPFVRPGLTLCNAAGVHNDATAELAVGLAISARRGLATFRDAQHAHEWAHRRHLALTDCAIAIVGFGDVGRRLASMLSGFDVTVTPFSRSSAHGARLIGELMETVGDFDVVVLTVPLTAETRSLVDAEFLSRMKTGALLVNVARGPVVDTDALLAELAAGRLSAALDVTDPEPLPPGHPLWDAPNCIITPHVGGNASTFERRIRHLVYSQLERLRDGRRLANVISAS